MTMKGWMRGYLDAWRGGWGLSLFVSKEAREMGKEAIYRKSRYVAIDGRIGRQSLWFIYTPVFAIR